MIRSPSIWKGHGGHGDRGAAFIGYTRLYPKMRVTEELLPRLRRLVKDLMEQRQLGKCRRPDLLSQLLRDGTLSDDDILYILFDLVIAGSDTTRRRSPRRCTSPRAAARLFHCCNAVDEALSVDLDGLRLEDIREALPYHVAVARGTLRLFPPVPFVGRTALCESTSSGTPAPEGAVACFSPYALGRDVEDDGRGRGRI